MNLKKIFLIFILTFGLFTTIIMAQESRSGYQRGYEMGYSLGYQPGHVEEKPPEGMEIIKVGSVRHLVPKGTRFVKRGGLIMFENIDQYVARRMTGIDKRLDEIEANQKAIQKTLYALSEERKGENAMEIISPAFLNKGHIPGKYTCDGEDINPPLTIKNIPKGAASLALIADDPDAPAGMWVHWVVYDIPVIAKIDENAIPGKQGLNDFGRRDYGGPCPPSGTHRYFFKVYALDRVLNLSEGIGKKELEKAMEGHILAKAELVGLYKRK